MFKKLSDNLNILMAKARLNSNELARLTGLPATTIKRIRTNEQSNPTVATLLPIAKYFSLTISELLECEAHQFEGIQCRTKFGLKAIPILSWHECIHFDLLDYTRIYKKIYTDRQVTDKGFALTIENNDLDFFPEKCQLIVEPNINPKSGNYVIATKSAQGIASIKKYIVETNQVYLKSLVAGLGITSLTSEYRVLGVIIQYKVELTEENK